jgi:hypothetical protein
MTKSASPASGWDSFTTAETSNDPYCITWAGQGKGGAGKTRFLLSAPAPIWVAVFSDPGGVSRLVKQHPELKKKDIRWKEYDFVPGAYKFEDRGQAARDVLAQFESDYATALKNARTVGWDKEDQVWELLRYAKLENYTSRPATYYELNQDYADWFQQAAKAGVNLGVMRGLKERWGLNNSGSPAGTGEFIPRGQREVNEKVMVVLDHYWDDDQREFITRIGSVDDPKCRIGPAKDLIGQEYTNLDFTTLAYMLYPETIDTPEVWA